MLSPRSIFRMFGCVGLLLLLLVGQAGIGACAVRCGPAPLLDSGSHLSTQVGIQGRWECCPPPGAGKRRPSAPGAMCHVFASLDKAMPAAQVLPTATAAALPWRVLALSVDPITGQPAPGLSRTPAPPHLPSALPLRI